MSMRLAATRTRIIALMVSLVLFTSCSPEKHYQTLAFFFDGVPDPAVQDESEATPVDSSSVTTVDRDISFTPKELNVVKEIVHQPFRERRCRDCHKVGEIASQAPQVSVLCFSCHDASLVDGSFLHGPVAVGGCLSCHLPHKSSEPFLLIDPSPALCLNCHDHADVYQNESHADVTDCLDCHDPHIGEDRMLLR